jgi:L-ascorbate metabolism protein UlaG (beta-lactamase superfamily)
MRNGAYRDVPSEFVIESIDGDFFYSADTALTNDMKLIKEAVELKFAALCIGGNFAMGVDEAVRCGIY